MMEEIGAMQHYGDLAMAEKISAVHNTQSSQRSNVSVGGAAIEERKLPNGRDFQEHSPTTRLSVSVHKLSNS